MGYLITPQPAKLIVSIFTHDASLFAAIERRLARQFGPIDFRSPLLDFNQTRYYEEEFGGNLRREFIAFKKLIKTESLWKIKAATNAMEKKCSRHGKRRVNIDPGYLTLANLILASTKMFFHRIHMNRGIYQEVTMIYQDKTWKPLPWTYPDYQTNECKDILSKIRAILRTQLQEK